MFHTFELQFYILIIKQMKMIFHFHQTKQNRYILLQLQQLFWYPFLLSTINYERSLDYTAF